MKLGRNRKKRGFKKGMGNIKGKIKSKRITLMPNGEYKGKRDVEGLNIYGTVYTYILGEGIYLWVLVFESQFRMA